MLPRKISIDIDLDFQSKKKKVDDFTVQRKFRQWHYFPKFRKRNVGGISFHCVSQNDKS